MFKTITTVVATLAVSGISNAQWEKDIQWPTSNGGNGHWYRLASDDNGINWNGAKAAAESMGGHLVTCNSSQEDDFVRDNLVECTSDGVPNKAAWMGGQKLDGSWTWITGEVWSYENWAANDPNSSDPDAVLNFHPTESDNCGWADVSPGDLWNYYVIEFSADCNGDGIVDYGQILDGSFSDLNQNGILDVCENMIVVPDDYSTIQEAVDQASAGSMIYLQPGTYVENVIIQDKQVFLSSLDGPDTTIIDANNSGSALTISGSGGHVINGLTFTRGSGFPAHGGGGISAESCTDLIIRSCSFIDNLNDSSLYSAGGIRVGNGSVSIENCFFINNKSMHNGSAIYLFSSNGSISECLFEGNGSPAMIDDSLASYDTVHYQSGSTGSVTDCLFRSNTIQAGEVGLHCNCNIDLYFCDFKSPLGPQDNAGSIIFAPDSCNDSAAIGGNTACEYPSPYIGVNHTEPIANYFTDAPCQTIIDCNSNEIDDADDIANGTSQDCNGNSTPDECDVANGTSNDCNANGIPDECEVLEDCNSNGIPDECESFDDCNSNNIPDECESLADCNNNGTPDDCETLADCDGDGTPDACEILDGAIDANPADGVPDECQGLPVGACCVNGQCSGLTAEQCFNLDGNFAGIGISCADANCPTSCPGDIDGDGQVGIVDILVVIDRWGFCP